MISRTNFRYWLASMVLGAACTSAFAQEGRLIINGAGWSQFGMIAKSLDTAEGKKLDNRALIGTGAQFAMTYVASEHLEANAGLGMAAGHQIAARKDNGFYAPMGIGPYVAAANMKYSFWKEEVRNLSMTAGLFPYDYAPDNQNLGLYLLRGPVWPGILMSGFETKYVMPVANTIGLQVHHQTGFFTHDFLLTFDSEWYPYWDVSPAYIANVQLGGALRLGAGVNFYHYIPVDKKMTTQKIKENAYIDTATHDTTYISFKGTKLMGNFTFDPKALLGYSGEGIMGAEDLKLYGEIGVIGLDNDKAHKALYGTLSQRMPMMIGFNLPAFKILDRLNVEVEYYGAKWVDDPSIYNHISGPPVTPIPKASASDTNTTKDNIKWSIYGSRVLAQHVKLSLQAASDHYRPGIFQGYGDNNPPLNGVPFFSPKEWYWETKIAYFF
jgi:hypothetical protein